MREKIIILATLHRSEGVNAGEKTVERTAVRAVIQHGRQLLMIHSANTGDYKFPGGGGQAGETHAQTLAREVAEECSMTLSHMGEEIGAVIEYDINTETGYDMFKMTSYYYRCEVTDVSGAQRLDDYERALGFTPVWVDIQAAIRVNKSLMESVNAPKWLRREIFVLEYLRENFN
ncbi:MAG: NUDIX hydrolase [Chloroflexota bacterium]